MKQTIIKYGIMAGLAVVGYFLLFYSINKTTMLGPSVQLPSYLVYFGFMFWAAKPYYNSDFKGILKVAFGVFVIANLFYYAFDFYLFNYMDKSLIDLQKDIMLDYFEGAAKSVEEASLRTQNIQSGDYHSLKSLIYAYAKGAIGGFGMAILVAYFVKKMNE
jgi:membrane associated rhomboid family serine protease